LDNAFPIAQVYENQIAMVTPPVEPTSQGDGLSYMGFA
jgi:hypothetical protein